MVWKSCVLAAFRIRCGLAELSTLVEYLDRWWNRGCRYFRYPRLESEY